MTAVEAPTPAQAIENVAPVLRKFLLAAETFIKQAQDHAEKSGCPDTATDLTRLLTHHKIWTKSGGLLDSLEAPSETRL